MLPPPTFSEIGAALTVSAAAITDLRYGKIPNRLTVPASLAAIVIQLFQSGPWGALWAVAGWLVGCLVMLVIKFFLRLMGFGDAKLIACLGAFLGPPRVLLVIFWFCLVFGLVAMWRILTAFPWSALTAGTRSPLGQSQLERFKAVLKSTIPLAPIIAAATFITLLFGRSILRLLG